MKLSKSFMKRLLIIVLSVFVILPVILMIVGVPKTLEGFYTLPTGSGKTLTGFDISGLKVYDGDASYTGLPGEALYCAYGDVSCTNSDYVLKNTRDASGIKLYQCVNSTDETDICANITICDSKITLKNGGTDSVSLYEFEDDTRCGFKKNASYTFKQFEFEDHDLSDNSNLQGFSTPFTSPPMEISDSYVYIYETDVSYSPCFLFETSQYNCLSSECDDDDSGKDSSDKDDDKEDDDCPSGTSTEKCVADFGTQVGEELCCGQTGVLQKGGEVCPKSKPICKGYECGTTWGKCYKK